MSGKRRKDRKARLEMTPLMDVMFLVLVFFVFAVSVMSVHRGIKVDLPEGAGVREEGERIVLTIRANDTLQFNGRDMTRAEIMERIRTLVRAHQTPAVFISGDRASSLGTGIGLLSELKSAGVEHVSFSVKSPH